MGKEISYNLSGNDRDTSKKKKMSAKRFFKQLWKKEKLMIFLLIAVIIGFLVGTLANGPVRALPEPTRTDVQVGVEFLVKIFLQCLRLVILPLIMSSLVRGMASLDTSSAGRIGLSALLYYFSTTVLAVITGMVLVVAISPGKRASYAVIRDENIAESRPMDLFLDIVRNMLPENIIQATFQTIKTSARSVTEYLNVEEIQVPPDYATWSDDLQDQFKAANNILNITQFPNGTFSAFNGTSRTYLLPSTSSYSNAMNMLGIITFCIVFGVFAGKMKDKSTEFLSVLETVELVTIKMIGLIMWMSPIGVCCLIIGQFWKIDDISSVFTSLALYLATILSGLIIHLFVSIMLIYFAFTRKNPLVFIRNMTKAILTGFATASSSATIPITLQCLDEKNNVDPRVSRFMIPVGATVNMDGTALYEAVAALFIAQVYGGNLSVGNVIVTSITATLASVGAAGVPQGGLVTLVIVLQVLGLPGDSLGLILSVDWLLDRFRTVVNILGDAFGCGVVEALNRKYLNSCPISNQSIESSCNQASANELDCGGGTSSTTDDQSTDRIL